MNFLLKWSSILRNRFSTKFLVIAPLGVKNDFMKVLNKEDEFILITTFSENKENVVVKKNQVAEKVDYEIVVKYEIYYKTISCQLYTNTVRSKFSFVPKSFGHNFAADLSLIHI